MIYQQTHNLLCRNRNKCNNKIKTYYRQCSLSWLQVAIMNYNSNHHEEDIAVITIIVAIMLAVVIMSTDHQ